MTPPLRVASLLASGTEIVCALGCEELLVGRSHECDFPESVKDLPPLSEPKFDIHLDSSTIDATIKSLVSEALSIYRIDGEKLRELNPNVIITQNHCNVCAVSFDDLCEALAGLGLESVEIVSLEPNSLEDVWNDIRKIALALNVEERGDELIHKMIGMMDRVQSRLGEMGKSDEFLPHRDAISHPNIVCIEWIEPPMVGGNWSPTLVQYAGGVDLLGKAGEHSPFIDWETIALADPDFILVMPCGFDIPRTRLEMKPLLAKEVWKNLRAVQDGHVYLLDGNQYFNRPGPRLVESVEIMAEIFHPTLFDFGHEGKGWERLYQKI